MESERRDTSKIVRKEIKKEISLSLSPLIVGDTKADASL